MRVPSCFAILCLLCAAATLNGRAQAQASNAAITENSDSPKPDANGTYKVGHGVLPPRLVAQPEPAYSDLARRKKLSGVCLVDMIVDAQGNPQNVHVLRSVGDGLKPGLQQAARSLDEQAVVAVKSYRFDPATLDGKAVPVEIHVEVNFLILKKGQAPPTPKAPLNVP